MLRIKRSRQVVSQDKNCRKNISSIKMKFPSKIAEKKDQKFAKVSTLFNNKNRESIA